MLCAPKFCKSPTVGRPGVALVALAALRPAMALAASADTVNDGGCPMPATSPPKVGVVAPGALPNAADRVGAVPAALADAGPNRRWIICSSNPMLRANWALLCGSGRGSLVVMTCIRSLICHVLSPSGPMATHAGFAFAATPSSDVTALSSLWVVSGLLSEAAEVDASLKGLSWVLRASALSGAAPVLSDWFAWAGL